MMRWEDLIAEIDAMMVCRSDGACTKCPHYSWCENNSNDGYRRPKDAPCMILLDQNEGQDKEENNEQTTII